jgi:hypothetical protein
MNIENSTPNEEQTTTSTPNLSELSFSEFEAVRKGGKLPEGATKSAPVEKSTEQNKSPESDTEENEAKDESEGESESEVDSEESNDSEKDKPKKKGGFQRRIDKLNARANAEKQRADALEARLAEIERSKESKRNPETSNSAAADGKPNPDHFDTHAEYIEALTDWKVEQKQVELDRKREQSKLQIEQEKAHKAHAERVKSFMEKTEDFEEVLEAADAVAISNEVYQALQEVVVSSEHGPELMYELAKDKAEYERIAKLSPIAAAREIGKIEAKIVARASSEKKPEPKKLTNAPKPIGPVGSGKSAVAKAPDEMSFSEYEKYRREQLKRKGA